VYAILNVCGLLFGVWCLVFGVWCLVFGVWCLKPPSPTLPPKGEGSLIILSYKKHKLFHTVQKATNEKTSKLPPWGIEGASKNTPPYTDI